VCCVTFNVFLTFSDLVLNLRPANFLLKILNLPAENPPPPPPPIYDFIFESLFCVFFHIQSNRWISTWSNVCSMFHKISSRVFLQKTESHSGDTWAPVNDDRMIILRWTLPVSMTLIVEHSNGDNESSISHTTLLGFTASLTVCHWAETIISPAASVLKSARVKTLVQICFTCSRSRLFETTERCVV